MKRFLLFAGDVFYPEGGWCDFDDDFDSLEAARVKLDERMSSGQAGWAHIYDLERRFIAYSTDD